MLLNTINDLDEHLSEHLIAYGRSTTSKFLFLNFYAKSGRFRPWELELLREGLRNINQFSRRAVSSYENACFSRTKAI